jgi:hypothetical protein
MIPAINNKFFTTQQIIILKHPPTHTHTHTHTYKRTHGFCCEIRDVNCTLSQNTK